MMQFFMDLLTLESFVLLVVGFFGGFLGATASGGGLVVMAALLYMGLPPYVASATALFGDIGLTTTTLEYKKSGQIVWKYVWLLLVLGCVGSLLGAQVLLTVPQEYMRAIMGGLLIVLVFFTFLKRKEPESTKVSTMRLRVSAFCYFVVQFVSGFFPAGTGPLTQLTLIRGLRLTIIQAAATKMIPFLVITVVTTLYFWSQNAIDFTRGVPLILGTAVGGVLGVKFALKWGAEWVKWLFMTAVVVAAIKLLWPFFTMLLSRM